MIMDGTNHEIIIHNIIVVNYVIFERSSVVMTEIVPLGSVVGITVITVVPVIIVGVDS